MNRHLRPILLAAVLMHTFLLAGPNQAADFLSEGKAIGEGRKQNMFDSIKPAISHDGGDVPFYNPNPPQAANFGKTTDLLSLGTNRISECGDAKPGTDKIANQECEAVNFLTKNPYERKTVKIEKDDPLFDNIRNAMENPPAGGSGQAGTDGQCVEKVEKQPDEYRKNFCDQWLIPEDKICNPVQNVTIDVDSLFSCNVTTLMTTNESCAAVKYSSYRIDSGSYTSPKNLVCSGGDAQVIGWYRNLLTRCPDADGLQYWTGLAQQLGYPEAYTHFQTGAAEELKVQDRNTWFCPSGGDLRYLSDQCQWSKVVMTPSYECTALASQSGESAGSYYSTLLPTTCSGDPTIQSWYRDYDKRCADVDGLNNWVNALNTTFKGDYAKTKEAWLAALNYNGGMGTSWKILCNAGDDYVFYTTTCRRNSPGNQMQYNVLLPTTCSGDPVIQGWYQTNDQRCADKNGMDYWINRLKTEFNGDYNAMYQAWYSGFMANGGKGQSLGHLCYAGDEYIPNSTWCRKRVFTSENACQPKGGTCIDTTPVKYFGGQAISVNDVGGCWEYRDNYQCERPVSDNRCNTLSTYPGCRQIVTTCSQTAFNGSCAAETKTYRCEDGSMGTPSGAIDLGDAIEIIDQVKNDSSCKPYAQNAECTQFQEVCVEPRQTKMVNGVVVWQECWKWERKYNCYSSDYINDCQSEVARNCKDNNKNVCLEYTAAGRCALWQKEFSCKVKDGVETTVQDCGMRSFCNIDANGNQQCWDTSYENDQDFLKAVVGMEAARQSGRYIDGSFKIFTGKASNCSKGLVGLKNCCEESGGARTNNTVMGELGTSVLKGAGGEVVNVGSKYMYDYMYPDMPWGSLSGEALLDFAPSFTPTNFQPSIGMYGFTLGTAAPQGAMTLASGIGGTQFGLYFDPWSFAIAIALQVVMELMTCDPSEQNLSMQKGAGLCVNLGPFCKSKFLGKCVEKGEGYCCFNSKLARIIQEQGRPMTGRSWGDPKNPDCSGFTADEFEKIDFGKLDLTEFVNDIMANVQIPNEGELAERVKAKLGK
jgi:conjugal transfer mating pair stabilization protein TraN